MKRLDMVLVAFAVCGTAFAATLTKDNLEIVAAADAAPAVRFAAKEAKEFLSQTLGAEIPVVDKPSDGKAHLFLGVNPWSEAAGVSISGIANDGFVTFAKGNDVFIVGEDDPKVDTAYRIKRPSWGSHHYSHGTLNGVYSFLEDIADVRFYFPGELGTCIVRQKFLTVPDGRKVTEPDLSVRQWSFYSDGEWPEGADAKRAIHPSKALNILRNRASTKDYGCCHGLNGFCYADRFGKTHPEYFALDSKGQRMIEGKGWQRGHLCLTSGIRDEIFKDCLSYLKGEPASVRGVPNRNRSRWNPAEFAWNYNTTPHYIDLMPQDGNAACCCENCKARLRKDGRKCPATELVWGLLAEVAERLKKEGFEPTLTMMSYADYADLPDCPIPPNIKVMVARTGPWKSMRPKGIEDDAAFYASWERRLGGKTWIWTYPRRGETLNYDIPGWAPRAWGRYYKGVAPHVFGVFAECETDRGIDNLMGYYMLSKIGWNINTDVDAVMDEFYVRMFGAATAEMKAALDAAEDKFMKDIVGKFRMTAVGPVSERPGEHSLWTEVYSAEETARIAQRYDAAARLVPAGSLEAKRIALFRKWMLELPLRCGAEYRSETDPKVGATYFKAHEKENLLGDRWWVSEGAGASRDNTTTIVGGESKKLVVTESRTSAWALSNYMKKDLVLQPGARYRLSWFVKVDLEPRQIGGGSAVSINLFSPDKKWKKSWVVPKRFAYHSGKVDWIRQSTEFTVPKDAPEGTCCSVMPFVRYCVGNAWFDGLLLESLQ
jgi:hypothetical protein